MSTKATTLIWVIEDDSVLRRQARELIEATFKRTKVDVIESLQWAMKLDSTPDLVLLDVGAISRSLSTVDSDVRDYSKKVVAFIEKNRSASIGLYSGVGAWATNVIEDLKSLVPDAHVEKVDFLDPKGMLGFVKKYRGEGSCKT